MVFWQNTILSSKLHLEIVLFWNPEVALQPQNSGGEKHSSKVKLSPLSFLFCTANKWKKKVSDQSPVGCFRENVFGGKFRTMKKEKETKKSYWYPILRENYGNVFLLQSCKNCDKYIWIICQCSSRMVKSMDSRQITWVSVQALPFTGWVTLWKLLGLSVSSSLK